MPDGSIPNTDPVLTPEEIADFKVTSDQIVPGKKNRFGEVVKYVYVATDRFIIYAAQAEGDDAPTVRYVIAGDFDKAQILRDYLAPFADEVTYIGDLVYQTRGQWFAEQPGNAYAQSVIWRALAPIARIIQLSFERNRDAAKQVVKRYVEEMEARRDSRNRMRYAMANALMAAGVVAVLWLLGYVGAAAWPYALPLVPPGVQGAETLVIVMFGALGAFFSVCCGLSAIRIRYAITTWEMRWSGLARILIGAIGAMAVVLLIQSGMLTVGGLKDIAPGAPELPKWLLYLFAFIAGFSEYFVPNALKLAETAARINGAETPAEPATT